MYTLTLVNKLMIKILHSKLVIMLEYQNTKIFWLKDIFHLTVFVIKEVKDTVPWTCVINDLNGEKIIGTFYEKE